MNVPTHQKKSSLMILFTRFRFLILLAVLAFAATQLTPSQIASAISVLTTDTTISTLAGGGFSSVGSPQTGANGVADRRCA